MTSRQRLVINAHRKAAYARSTGKLKAAPCVVCGNPHVEGHHPDYAKPLEVVWLCARHHTDLHAGRLQQEPLQNYVRLVERHNNWLKDNHPHLAR